MRQTVGGLAQVDVRTPSKLVQRRPFHSLEFLVSWRRKMLERLE